jgi:hypothetical protein
VKAIGAWLQLIGILLMCVGGAILGSIALICFVCIPDWWRHSRERRITRRLVRQGRKEA